MARENFSIGVFYNITKNQVVSDIAIFVLKRDVKLQLTNQKSGQSDQNCRTR